MIWLLPPPHPPFPVIELSRRHTGRLTSAPAYNHMLRITAAKNQYLAFYKFV
jgi:hypothetical protein